MVARMVAPITEPGSRDPSSALRESTVVGTNVRLDAVTMANVHMASVGSRCCADMRSLAPRDMFAPRERRASAASSSMARSPKGVAALPSPRRFAAMLVAMYPTARERGEMPGKRGDMSGLTRSASCDISPDSSAILAIPDQSAMDPESPMHTCIASLVEDNAILVTLPAPFMMMARIMPKHNISSHILLTWPFLLWVPIASLDISNRLNRILLQCSGMTSPDVCPGLYTESRRESNASWGIREERNRLR